MPADIADIAAASRDAVTATWSSATVAARFPNARDGTVKPATGYCDSVADAQVLVDARGALIGTDRRRFAVDVHELIWPDIEAGLPTLRLIDAEQRADLPCLTARIEIDLDAAATSLELFG